MRAADAHTALISACCAAAPAPDLPSPLLSLVPQFYPTPDRRRTEAHGSYARRKHAETDDNPLYRLPEQPSGSQRLDGLSQWSAKAQQYQHH